MKERKKKWINGLDSLRFILALIVMLSHLPNPVAQYLKQNSFFPVKLIGVILSNIFSGPSAVMAFFIISGFVVHYPVKDTIFNNIHFIVRRWIRVGLPLLIIGTIAAIFSDYGAIPVWSLYCELIYYTIYPFIIKIKQPWWKIIAITYIISFILLIIFANNELLSFIYHKNINYRGLYWQLGDKLTWLMGLPVWLLGVWLADKIDSIELKSPYNSYRCLLAARAIMLGLSAVMEVARFHAFLSNLVALNYFSILILVWLMLEIKYYQDKKPYVWLEKFGKFSYSLYLCHILIIQALGLLLNLSISSYILYIIITLIVSYIVYLLIEKPSQQLSHIVIQKMTKS